MGPRVVRRVPPELLQRSIRVIKPQDGRAIYANPRAEFIRLTERGALHRLATGYYAIVPDDRIGQHWLPELESAALGIAAADEGIASVALMGVSAARVHGALPRAVNVATVAAENHRRPIHFSDRDAVAIFARRKFSRLEVERHTLELGQGWVTTVEQTVLDLATRPDLGGIPNETRSAAYTLLARSDSEVLRDLASVQRARAPLARLKAGRHA